MKKKVLILTLNDYIIYQPTLLNLYDFMSKEFNVTVVSFSPQYITKAKDETRNVIYLKPHFFLRHLFQKFDFITSNVFRIASKFLKLKEYNFFYYNNYLPYFLKSSVKKRKLAGDIIIAVDLPALHIAQKLFGSVHFLSLEIENNKNPIYKKFDSSKIKSVVIQSKERYDYLFPSMTLPTFLIQNAPVFIKENITDYNRHDFIWAGTIQRRWGILDCINFFKEHDQYKLVIKGGADRKSLRIINELYHPLIEANRLVIDNSYLPATSFLDYLSHFRIGFCFYSWELIRQSFNYATAPSGKLFMYLAAGVPVIACNIPAFKLIETYGAGVLIDDFDPQTILQAVIKIESDYDKFSKACYVAADYFSFDKNVDPYIHYLLSCDSDGESSQLFKKQ